MSEKARNRLIHALLSVMLAAGLLLPLLGVMHPSFLSASVVLPLLLTVILFEAASWNRTAALSAAGLGIVALLVWLFAMGGAIVVSDVVLAVSLRFSGIRSALPLVARQAVLLTTVAVTLLSCFACLRNASAIPALLLCMLVVLLLYLTDSARLIPWFLPALAALLLILFTDRFRETPVLQLLPWVVLLVAAAFLVAGRGTGDNALKQKADDLRQAVMDRLFFTEPRDVFSLSAEGFYPEGQEQLGGKPDPNDHPVMQVSAPRTVYLRGVVLNEYTGRSWRNTTGGRRYLWQSPRQADRRAALFDQALPPAMVQNTLCSPSAVSVRMLSDSASTLFAPQRVRDMTPGGGLVPYFSNSSELFVTRNLQAGDTYSFSAPVFQAGDPGLGTLIEVCSTFDDPEYDKVRETYLVLPSHLEEPVYALAEEASSVASSPYDKALAIQSWLQRSFRYTLDVEDQPPDMDFVTSFLLVTKEGYCTYFASSMTVLCRMAGLPARYVEGYVAEPDDRGEALVTGMSAHAWTEVYFKGFGWLTFDPTPRAGNSSGQDEPSATSPESTPEPTPTPEPENPGEEPTPEPEAGKTTPEPTPEPSEEPSPEPSPDPSVEPESPEPPDNDTDREPPPESRKDNPPFPWLWFVFLLLFLLLAGRVLLTSPAVRANRARDEDAVLDVWAQEIFDLLAAENLFRRRDESPMAFCRRVDRLAAFSVALGPVGECLSLIRYSTARAQETDTQLLHDTALVLRSELANPARLRYLIRRIFLPLSRRQWSVVR